jgi:hypothetical protein
MIVCLPIANIFICDTFRTFFFLLETQNSQKRKKASENNLASLFVLGRIPFITQA